MGGVNISKLLLVVKVVEKEVRGESGVGYSRNSRSNGPGYKTRSGGAGRAGSTDWVWVKGSRENGFVPKPVFGSQKGMSRPKQKIGELAHVTEALPTSLTLNYWKEKKRDNVLSAVVHIIQCTNAQISSSRC